MIAGAMALIATPRVAFPQTTARIWRVGCIALDGTSAWFAGVVRELQGLGYEEGKNIAFEYKLAMGQPSRLNPLAAELVASKVDLIVAFHNPEVQAAMRATKTIPILMMFAVAPVEMGLIASLARPGGNVTGTTTNAPELVGKMVEVMRDALPNSKRWAALFDPEFPGVASYLQQMEGAAAAMGITLAFLPVHSAEDLDKSLLAIERSHPDAIAISTTGIVAVNIQRVIAFAARQRLPALYSTRFPVPLGGLMSYSPNFRAMAKRNAWMIDRILKGAKPSDIPVEEPAEFELTVNARTAKALGITIPQSLLLRADEVIQ